MASIKERNGKFVVIYSYKDENDNRKQKWETYKTKSEAKKRKQEIEYKQEMEAIFQQYPKVLDAVDTETAAELSQQECAALIKVMELRNNLTDIEMQTVYFRGCYDSVGYLKKAGIL